MQIATINQPSRRLKFEPTYNINIRKTEIMSETKLVKFLRKFFWMNKQNHRHVIHHLSDHLKRDMGLIEQDFNSKPRKNDQNSTATRPQRLWL